MFKCFFLNVFIMYFYMCQYTQNDLYVLYYSIIHNYILTKKLYSILFYADLCLAIFFKQLFVFFFCPGDSRQNSDSQSQYFWQHLCNIMQSLHYHVSVKCPNLTQLHQRTPDCSCLISSWPVYLIATPLTFKRELHLLLRLLQEVIYKQATQSASFSHNRPNICQALLAFNPALWRRNLSQQRRC